MEEEHTPEQQQQRQQAPVPPCVFAELPPDLLHLVLGLVPSHDRPALLGTSLSFASTVLSAGVVELRLDVRRSTAECAAVAGLMRRLETTSPFSEQQPWRDGRMVVHGCRSNDLETRLEQLRQARVQFTSVSHVEFGWKSTGHPPSIDVLRHLAPHLDTLTVYRYPRGHTSLYRGVSLGLTTRTGVKQWKAKATLVVTGYKVLNRLFDTAEEAARAYDRACIDYGVAGAPFNFPDEDYHDEEEEEEEGDEA